MACRRTVGVGDLRPVAAAAVGLGEIRAIRNVKGIEGSLIVRVKWGGAGCRLPGHRSGLGSLPLIFGAWCCNDRLPAAYRDGAESNRGRVVDSRLA